jgi:hypothetical protein
MRHFLFSTGFTLNERRFVFNMNVPEPQIDMTAIDATIGKDIERNLAPADVKTTPEIPVGTNLLEKVVAPKAQKAADAMDGAKLKIADIAKNPIVGSVKDFVKDPKAGIKNVLAGVSGKATEFGTKAPKDSFVRKAADGVAGLARQGSDLMDTKPADAQVVSTESNPDKNAEPANQTAEQGPLTRQKVVESAATDDKAGAMFDELASTPEARRNKATYVAGDKRTIEATVEQRGVTREEVVAFRPTTREGTNQFIADVAELRGNVPDASKEQGAKDSSEVGGEKAKDGLSELRDAKTPGEFVAALFKILEKLSNGIEENDKKKSESIDAEKKEEKNESKNSSVRVMEDLSEKEKGVSIKDMPNKLAEIKTENAKERQSHVDKNIKTKERSDFSAKENEKLIPEKAQMEAELKELQTSGKDPKLAKALEDQIKTTTALIQSNKDLIKSSDKLIALREDAIAGLDEQDKIIDAIGAIATVMLKVLDEAQKIADKQKMKMPLPDISYKNGKFVAVFNGDIDAGVRTMLEPGSKSNDPISINIDQVGALKDNVDDAKTDANKKEGTEKKEEDKSDNLKRLLENKLTDMLGSSSFVRNAAMVVKGEGDSYTLTMDKALIATHLKENGSKPADAAKLQKIESAFRIEDKFSKRVSTMPMTAQNTQSFINALKA